LLDVERDACLIYDARPIACRAYGFYAERDKVLGCSQIESLARETPDVIWGNHAALDAEMQGLGADAPLSEWLAKS
jgi:Fe-S-cluster containining protein